MALDALLFDLDGTLIDTNGQHALAWAEAIGRFGYRIPAERVLLEIGKGGDRLVPALLGDRVEEEEGEALREAHGELFQERIAREGVKVFPGTRKLLAACRERGLRTAVATASKKEQLDEMLERAGLELDELVDAVVNDSDVDRSKPNPDVVDAAVGKLGLSAAQCAMVGDTPYDATAARRAGVVCFGVLTGAHPAAALRRAWARAVWRDAAELHERLDAALALASPGEARWSQDRLDAVMGDALGEARRAAESGEEAVGAVVVDGGGRRLAA
ncbi:MAG TPA: HAD family hydrolase, partial [Thermoanaerobaculia bacterium]|nr:HAD family hydrolase [Thermoanaerobaculia bacterium]